MSRICKPIAGGLYTKIILSSMGISKQINDEYPLTKMLIDEREAFQGRRLQSWCVLYVAYAILTLCTPALSWKEITLLASCMLLAMLIASQYRLNGLLSHRKVTREAVSRIQTNPHTSEQSLDRLKKIMAYKGELTVEDVVALDELDSIKRHRH